MNCSLVLLSGGLDSTVVLYYARSIHDQVHALSVNYGQRHERELMHAEHTCAAMQVPHMVLDVSRLGPFLSSSLTQGDLPIPHDDYELSNITSTIVPNRNAILISIAVGVAISAGDMHLYLAIHSGDHDLYPDCRPDFMEAMQNAVDTGNLEKLALETPFLHMTKADIVRIGNDLGVPWKDTWSCYEGGELHCGQCATCRERREAFDIAGVCDPTSYAL